jgi:hypothetical protein
MNKKYSVAEAYALLKGSLGDNLSISQKDFTGKLIADPNYLMATTKAIGKLDNDFDADIFAAQLKKKDGATDFSSSFGPKGQAISSNAVGVGGIIKGKTKQEKRDNFTRKWMDENVLIPIQNGTFDFDTSTNELGRAYDLAYANFIGGTFDRLQREEYANGLGETDESAIPKYDYIGQIDMERTDWFGNSLQTILSEQFPNGMPTSLDHASLMNTQFEQRVKEINEINSFMEDPVGSELREDYFIDKYGVQTFGDLYNKGNELYEAPFNYSIIGDEPFEFSGSLEEAEQAIQEMASTPQALKYSAVNTALQWYQSNANELENRHPEYFETVRREKEIQIQADAIYQALQGEGSGPYKTGRFVVKKIMEASKDVVGLVNGIYSQFNGGDYDGAARSFEQMVDFVDPENYATTATTSKAQGSQTEYFQGVTYEGKRYNVVFESEDGGEVMHVRNAQGYMVPSTQEKTIEDVTRIAKVQLSQGQEMEKDFSAYRFANQALNITADMLTMIYGGRALAATKFIQKPVNLAYKTFKRADDVTDFASIRKFNQKSLLTRRLNSAPQPSKLEVPKSGAARKAELYRQAGSEVVLFTQVYEPFYQAAIDNGATPQIAGWSALGQSLAMLVANRFNPEWNYLNNDYTTLTESMISKFVAGRFNGVDILKMSAGKVFTDVLPAVAKEAGEEGLIEPFVSKVAYGVESMFTGNYVDTGDFLSQEDVEAMKIAGVTSFVLPSSNVVLGSKISSLQQDVLFRSYRNRNKLFNTLPNLVGKRKFNTTDGEVMFSKKDIDFARKEFEDLFEAVDIDMRVNKVDFTSSQLRQYLSLKMTFKNLNKQLSTFEGVNSESDLTEAINVVKKNRDKVKDLIKKALDSPESLDLLDIDPLTRSEQTAQTIGTVLNAFQKKTNETIKLDGIPIETPKTLEELGAQLASNFGGAQVYVSQSEFDEAVKSSGIPLNRHSSVKGFYDENIGAIYINPSIATLGTAVHEFTHIWMNYVKRNNKDLYDRMINLVGNDATLMEMVQDVDEYKDQGRVREEALVVAIEKRAESVIKDKTVLNQFLEMVNEMFAYLKKEFGIGEDVNFETMTLNEFINRGAYETLTGDFLVGGNSVRSAAKVTFKNAENKRVRQVKKDGSVVEGTLIKTSQGYGIRRANGLVDKVQPLAVKNKPIGRYGLRISDNAGRVTRDFSPSSAPNLIGVDGVMYEFNDDSAIYKDGKLSGFKFTDILNKEDVFFPIESSVTEEIIAALPAPFLSLTRELNMILPTENELPEMATHSDVMSFLSSYVSDLADKLGVEIRYIPTEEVDVNGRVTPLYKNMLELLESANSIDAFMSALTVLRTNRINKSDSLREKVETLRTTIGANLIGPDASYTTADPITPFMEEERSKILNMLQPELNQEVDPASTFILQYDNDNPYGQLLPSIAGLMFDLATSGRMQPVLTIQKINEDGTLSEEFEQDQEQAERTKFRQFSEYRRKIRAAYRTVVGKYVNRESEGWTREDETALEVLSTLTRDIERRRAFMLGDVDAIRQEVPMGWDEQLSDFKIGSMTMTDYGKMHGVNENFGGVREPVAVKVNSEGVTWMIPNGLDGVFSLAEMYWMNAQQWDASALSDEVAVKLEEKIQRSVDEFRTMGFGQNELNDRRLYMQGLVVRKNIQELGLSNGKEILSAMTMNLRPRSVSNIFSSDSTSVRSATSNAFTSKAIGSGLVLNAIRKTFSVSETRLEYIKDLYQRVKNKFISAQSNIQLNRKGQMESGQMGKQDVADRNYGLPQFLRDRNMNTPFLEEMENPMTQTNIWYHGSKNSDELAATGFVENSGKGNYNGLVFFAPNAGLSFEFQQDSKASSLFEVKLDADTRLFDANSIEEVIFDLYRGIQAFGIDIQKTKINDVGTEFVVVERVVGDFLDGKVSKMITIGRNYDNLVNTLTDYENAFGVIGADVGFDDPEFAAHVDKIRNRLQALIAERLSAKNIESLEILHNKVFDDNQIIMLREIASELALQRSESELERIAMTQIALAKIARGYADPNVRAKMGDLNMENISTQVYTLIKNGVDKTGMALQGITAFSFQHSDALHRAPIPYFVDINSPAGYKKFNKVYNLEDLAVDFEKVEELFSNDYGNDKNINNLLQSYGFWLKGLGGDAFLNHDSSTVIPMVLSNMRINNITPMQVMSATKDDGQTPFMLRVLLQSHLTTKTDMELADPSDTSGLFGRQVAALENLLKVHNNIIEVTKSSELGMDGQGLLRTVGKVAEIFNAPLINSGMSQEEVKDVYQGIIDDASSQSSSVFSANKDASKTSLSLIYDGVYNPENMPFNTKFEDLDVNAQINLLEQFREQLKSLGAIYRKEYGLDVFAMPFIADSMRDITSLIFDLKSDVFIPSLNNELKDILKRLPVWGKFGERGHVLNVMGVIRETSEIMSESARDARKWINETSGKLSEEDSSNTNIVKAREVAKDIRTLVEESTVRLNRYTPYGFEGMVESFAALSKGSERNHWVPLERTSLVRAYNNASSVDGLLVREGNADKDSRRNNVALLDYSKVQFIDRRFIDDLKQDEKQTTAEEAFGDPVRGAALREDSNYLLAPEVNVTMTPALMSDYFFKEVLKEITYLEESIQEAENFDDFMGQGDVSENLNAALEAVGKELISFFNLNGLISVKDMLSLAKKMGQDERLDDITLMSKIDTDYDVQRSGQLRLPVETFPLGAIPQLPQVNQEKAKNAHKKLKQSDVKDPNDIADTLYFSIDNPNENNQLNDLVEELMAQGISADEIVEYLDTNEILPRRYGAQMVRGLMELAEYDKENRKGFVTMAQNMNDEEKERIIEDARMYIPVSNRISSVQANTIIDLMGLGDVVTLLLNAHRSDFNPFEGLNENFRMSATRTALTFEAQNRLEQQKAEFEKNGELERAQDVQRIINNLIESLTADLTSAGQFTQAMKLYGMSNTQSFISMIKRELTKRGGKELNDDDIETFTELHANYKNAPEGLPKVIAERKLMFEFQARLPMRLFQQLENQYYANLLSGYGTQLKNIFGAVSQIFTEGFVAPIADMSLGSMVAYFGALSKGFVKSVPQLMLAVKDGIQYPIDGNAEGKFGIEGRDGIPFYEMLRYNSFAEGRDEKGRVQFSSTAKNRGLRNLENFVARTLLFAFNPAAMKMVGRTLTGMDIYLSNVAKYAHQGVVMRKLRNEGHTEGLTAEQLAMYEEEVRNNFLNTPTIEQEKELMVRFGAQAEQEGFEKGSNEYKLRVFELTQKELIPEEVQQVTARFGQEMTFNYDPEGIMGLLYQGITGMMKNAEMVSMKTGGPANVMIRMGKGLFLPFVRVLMNVGNRMWAYTPMSALSSSQWTGRRARLSEAVEISDEQRARGFARTFIGTMSMAGLYAMSVGDDEDESVITITGAGTGRFYNDYQLQQDNNYLPYTITFNKIKIDGKPVRINYKDSILFMPLAMIGSLRDYERFADVDSETQNLFFKEMSVMAMSAFTSFSDLTIITSLSEIFEGVNQSGFASEKQYQQFFDRELEKVLGKLATTTRSVMVPNLLTQVNRSMRDYLELPIQQKMSWHTAVYRDLSLTDPKYPIVDHLGFPVVPDALNSYVPILTGKKRNMTDGRNFFYETFVNNNIFVGPPSYPTLVNPETLLPEELTKEEEFVYYALRGSYLHDLMENLSENDGLKLDITEDLERFFEGMEGVEDVNAKVKEGNTEYLKSLLRSLTNVANAQAKQYLFEMKYLDKVTMKQPSYLMVDLDRIDL